MATITLWFTLGAVGMALGTLALAAGLRVVPQGARRRYAILIAVPFIAVVAYGLMALGFGGVETPTGSTLYVPRYLDWLLTTPLHIVYIGLLAGAATSVIGRAAALQALTIVAGLAAALVGGPAKWALYLLGLGAFAVVVYYTLNDFDEAARTRSGTQYALFRQLRAFLVVLWLVYPVIWVVGGPGIGLMDTETASLVISYLDVVAKVGLGLIVLNSWLGEEATEASAAPAD